MHNHILFYDTETTGLPDWQGPSNSERQPHIVQLAAHLVDADTKAIVQTMDVIIRPDGWEIPEDVSKIHGITNEFAMHVGVPENLALFMFLSLWGGSRRVAHNRSFDQRIIRIAIKRYSNDATAEKWAEKDTHGCTMQMAKPIMQLESSNKGYKNPNLGEAYKFFTGKKLENAHSAIADTNACMEIYWHILTDDWQKER